MDFNLAVICGRLAAPPERLSGREDGPDRARLLIGVSSAWPQIRYDLIPIVVADFAELGECHPGQRVHAVGGLQRSFSSATGRSRLEILAPRVEVKSD